MSWIEVCAAARENLGVLTRLVDAVWSHNRIATPPVLLLATWQTLCDAIGNNSNQDNNSDDNDDDVVRTCAMEIDVFVTALKHASERVYSKDELALIATNVTNGRISKRDIFSHSWPTVGLVQQQQSAAVDVTSVVSKSVNNDAPVAPVAPVAASVVHDVTSNGSSSSSASSSSFLNDKAFRCLLNAAELAHTLLLDLMRPADYLNQQYTPRTASATDSMDAAVAAMASSFAIPDSAALLDFEVAAGNVFPIAATASSRADDKKLAVAFSASLARLDSAVPAHTLAADDGDDALVPLPVSAVDDAMAAIAPTTIPTTTQLATPLRLPEKDCTALMAAARMGHVEVVKLLLGAGATVDQRGGVGESALMIAAACGHESTVRVLVAGGATPNQAARDGGTPLMHASRAGHTNVVRALVQLGANLDVAAASGDTALMLASTGGHVASVMVLLEAGALVALARAHDGVTALHLAATHRHTTVMHLLTDCGASCALVIDTATSEERRAQLLQQSPRKCVTCAKSLKPAQVKMCAGCKLVPYCSPECQRTDWKRHKQTCKLWQASKASASAVAAESAAAAAEATAAAASAAASAAAATAAAAQALANAKARMAAEAAHANEKKATASPATAAASALLEEQD
jgi:ankyrin repeat protein